MEIIVHLLKTMPLIFIGFSSLLIFFILSFFLYFYLNIHLKGICKILVGDEDWYKKPLGPIDFHILSALPIIFLKEVLNIKKNINFKKLYNKNFYFSLNKHDLQMLIKEYPVFFLTQYTLFLFGIIFILFICSAYIIGNFF